MLDATTTISQIAGPTATKGTNGENPSAGIAVPRSGANTQHATESGVETIIGPIPTATTTVETLTAGSTLGDRVPRTSPPDCSPPRLQWFARAALGAVTGREPFRVDSTRKARLSQSRIEPCPNSTPRS